MSGLRKTLSNAFGWRTSRRIVVFESDDWGSIRTRSKADYEALLAGGLEMDRSNFTANDSLESNSDLEQLFDLLLRHKDSTGRSPVFTPMCIMANPDFDKIKASGFREYYYEPITETCKRYPDHDRVLDLWRKGIEERLFVPALHGREHLNPVRWLSLIRNGNAGLLMAFDHQSFGIARYRGEQLPDYLAAFKPDKASEILAYENVIESAAALFEIYSGRSPEYFIAPNSPEPKSLETVLDKVGIKYLTRYKIHQYPLGDGKYSWELNWLGKKNKLNQVYLTRNCAFEPSDSLHADWVDVCIAEIENAFRWHKPAIISTHRVNYTGYINPQNAAHGLKELDRLLTAILNKWPEAEFMTSVELGDLISSSKDRKF